MPEKPSVAGFDKCNRCSTASDGRAHGQAHGQAHGPSPATHAEICCIFSLAHPGPSNYDWCKACPGSTSQKQHELPKTPTSPPQEGLAAGGETEPARTDTRTRKRKKIEPRLRVGFTKLTLEIRPQRFKKKLWFGTYTKEEIDRARDAVNYYMQCNQPYKYPDSPLIFASKPLKGITFEDLQPSCEDWIQVGDAKRELKYKYFARQVKDVIHSVTGKQKKSAASLSKRNKGKVSQSPAQKQEPTTPSGAPSPTSSGSQERQLDAWDTNPEANSELSAMHTSLLPPPPEMLTYEEEMQISELLRSGAQKEEVMGYTLQEMFALTPFPFEESTTTEEEDFSEILWAFQNGELP